MKPEHSTNPTNPTNPTTPPLSFADSLRPLAAESESAEKDGLHEARKAADRAAASMREALGSNVTGIYLHGSLAIGGFNPSSSDIDLLVVVRRRPEREELHRLTRGTLDVHTDFPEGRDLEFSVVEESVLRAFVHPALCVYHYSGAHRNRYASDPKYLCADYEDADLAAQITVAYERGVALYGPPLRHSYPPVPKADYLDSVWSDVCSAEAEIADNPVYFTLNLCRVLMFLEQGTVASKKEGGEWAEASLPEWADVVRPILDAYTGTGQSNHPVPTVRLVEFARTMLQAIRANRTSS